MAILLVNKNNKLSSRFVPKDMVEIHEPTGIKDDPNYVNMMDKFAYDAFKEMQKDALALGYEIFIDSSYRSYEYQQDVYNKSIKEKGTEYTKAYCALPGASEHQTGLAFDVIARRDNVMIEESKNDDPELVWCMNNAYKYGFILRYPLGKEDITGYNFEPWHYRYVGKDVAKYMHDNNIETLEEYVLLQKINNSLETFNYEKIINDFADEYLSKSVHANREEVINVLREAAKIINKNKDKTPEEIVDIFISSTVDDLNKIIDNYSVPGIASSLKVDNININLYGGSLRPNGERLDKNAIFDIASITKLYTEIIAYKMIADGAFRLEDKIKDLDPRFENVGDLTVEQVLRFVTTFKTNGRIDDVKNKSEALEKLFAINVVQCGKEYNYNDMGLMIMKEVMESISGKSYKELFDYYVVKPYGLDETYLVVPEDKIYLVTGTPNIDGSVNDPKANAMGGFSGHAGVRATSSDLIKLGTAINNDYSLQKGLYVSHSMKEVRSSKMGNVFINPKLFNNTWKEEFSYFGKLALQKSLAAQGSTRVIVRASDYNGLDINSTALTNIASVTDDKMIEFIERENEQRLLKDKNLGLLNPNNLIKERIYNGKSYKMHDPRSLLDEDSTIGKVLYNYDNKVVLKLLLLNKILKEYEHYYRDINIDINIKKRIK